MKKRITKNTKRNLLARFDYNRFEPEEMIENFIAWNSAVLYQYTTSQLERMVECRKPIVENFTQILDEFEYWRVFDLIATPDAFEKRIEQINKQYISTFNLVVKSVLETRPDYKTYKRNIKLQELLSETKSPDDFSSTQNIRKD